MILRQQYFHLKMHSFLIRLRIGVLYFAGRKIVDLRP